MNNIMFGGWPDTKALLKLGEAPAPTPTSASPKVRAAITALLHFRRCMQQLTEKEQMEVSNYDWSHDGN